MAVYCLGRSEGVKGDSKEGQRQRQWGNCVMSVSINSLDCGPNWR